MGITSIPVKPRYKLTDAEIVPADLLWPEREACKGKYVAVGVFVFPGGERGKRGLTSLIVSGGISEGYVETMSSHYSFV